MGIMWIMLLYTHKDIFTQRLFMFDQKMSSFIRKSPGKYEHKVFHTNNRKNPTN